MYVTMFMLVPCTYASNPRCMTWWCFIEQNIDYILFKDAETLVCLFVYPHFVVRDLQIMKIKMRHNVLDLRRKNGIKAF